MHDWDQEEWTLLGTCLLEKHTTSPLPSLNILSCGEPAAEVPESKCVIGA